MKKLNPFAGKNKGRSWFWWGINIGILLALVVWWWMENQPDEESESQITIDQEKADKVAVEPDNLKVIVGIGRKSAQVLGEAGILTFAALAVLSPDEINGVLKAAGVRVPYPETWPEQAALAAAGKWDELKELQSSLVGGRRV